MGNLINMNDFVNTKDLKEFNKELMKMISKLQDENDFLNEKVVHLEGLLLSDPTIKIIGG